MDRTKWPALCGLLGATIYLTFSTDTTFAFDKPVHTQIAVLLACGATLFASSAVLFQDTSNNISKELARDLPLLYSPTLRRPTHVFESTFDSLNVPQKWRVSPIAFAVLTASLITRAAIFHGMWNKVECIATTLEPLLPLIFIIIHLRTTRLDTIGPDQRDSDDPNAARSLRRYSVNLFVAVLAACITGIIALRSFGAPRSTYICATITPFIWMTPFIQHFAVVVDAVILYTISHILEHDGIREQASSIDAVKVKVIASSCIAAGLGLLAFGGVYFYITPQDRVWILYMPTSYIWSTVTLSMTLGIASLALLITLYHIGLLATTVILVGTAVLTTTTASAWSLMRHHASTTTSAGFVAIIIFIWSFGAYFQSDVASTTLSVARPRRAFSRVSPLLYVLFMTILLVHASLWFMHSSTISYHPVDVLMWDADERHQTYLNQSKSSKTLQEAVDTYHQRYGRWPPPNFDSWYKYAVARNSLIIDDFDSINRDLLPFFALSPAEIRERTTALIVHPWNDVGAISIRDGKVTPGPHIVPTHYWMIEGLVKMIEKFSKFLPDMDLAFNLNDEPRVAVPYERISFLENTALSQAAANHTQAQFEPGRATHWPKIPDTPTGNNILEELSSDNIFQSYGAIGCSPSSPARSKRRWNKKSSCIACSAPHSLRGFMANWTMSSDVCYQPDLEDLSGIYISPAAFKGSHKLYPVFSQGKPIGFNDILYPSAWLYIDKAQYAPTKEFEDPPWAEKTSDLFWRGSTTDGVSGGLGYWHGMLRARFNHLINNIKNTSPPSYIPLPLDKEQKAHSFHRAPARDLTKLLKTDVKITPDIARCGGDDCARQRWEFAPTQNTSDFQAHWTHKYLLDLDGAGFSGRFLPFMQSRSLPFKAGVFREWWDDRVTPWLHFVPLDVRGQGFWGTLAYFAGLDGYVGGKKVNMPAREAEAEKIALAGRAWAYQALRKEDMEIYMFRLLLEWARITDDWRDDIGYSGSSGSV